ncbi:MAG TPA: hypothetical protein VH373_21760 [Jatrophihabitantaceae bacterium]|jgi:hypothetical protein
MNGIQYALRRIHHGENEAAKELLRLADRHRTDHEVHHVARDLASWSHEHVQLLAQHATRFGLNLDDEADTPNGITSQVRETLAHAAGRHPEPGLSLLEDLRHLHLRASENSLAWEMLAQVAQAQHERELLDLTEKCHPQTLRQIRWANTTIKTQTPQVLASL